MTATCRCGKFVEADRDECFRCRVATVGFAMAGPAQRHNFHQTKNEWMQENLGTTNERELAARGIERA